MVDIPNSSLYYDVHAKVTFLFLKAMTGDVTYLFPLSILMQGDLYDILAETLVVSFRNVKMIEKQVIDFITSLHNKQIYHFDIKPENVLYIKKNINGNVYVDIAVSDYGMLTTPDIEYFNGTLAYMSPLLLLFNNINYAFFKEHARHNPIFLNSIWNNHVVVYNIIINKVQDEYLRRMLIYEINDMYAVGVMLRELYENTNVRNPQKPSQIYHKQQQYIENTYIRVNIENLKQRIQELQTTKKLHIGGSVKNVSFVKNVRGKKMVVIRKLIVVGKMMGVKERQPNGSYGFKKLSKLNNAQII